MKLYRSRDKLFRSNSDRTVYSTQKRKKRKRRRSRRVIKEPTTPTVSFSHVPKYLDAKGHPLLPGEIDVISEYIDRIMEEELNIVTIRKWKCKRLPSGYRFIHTELAPNGIGEPFLLSLYLKVDTDDKAYILYTYRSCMLN